MTDHLGHPLITTSSRTSCHCWQRPCVCPPIPQMPDDSFTIAFPHPSLWTRLYCALWWGHRPMRYDFFNFGSFARDELTCRCGKVTDTAENVERLSWSP